jgi:hypothetical protein
MKGELKRLRHDLIMGTSKSKGMQFEDDDDISPDEMAAFKLLSPEVRRFLMDCVQA